MAALESENKVTVNWSELPPDILHLISRKLHDIFDFIRFRAVCPRWRLPSLVSDPQPMLPWLLIIPYPFTRTIENHHQLFYTLYTPIRIKENHQQLFYSLSSKKFFTIPSALSNTHRSSSHRYLVLLHNDYQTIRALFNPVTGNEAPLPIARLSWFDDVRVSGDSIMIYRSHLSKISIWKPGHAEWISMKVDEPDHSLPMLAYCNGFCFSVDKSNWITEVLDPKDTCGILKTPPPVGDSNFKGFHYLIESFGELLAVCRFTYHLNKESRFVVYRLHCCNGDLSWVKMSNIGDRILLLDQHGGTGLSILARGKHGELKGNCIYFHVVQHDNKSKFIVLCRYDMQDHKIEELERFCELKGCTLCWFVPSLE